MDRYTLYCSSTKRQTYRPALRLRIAQSMPSFRFHGHESRDRKIMDGVQDNRSLTIAEEH